MPAHPPIQAKHPGRKPIAPHKQEKDHEATMKRPAEKLHLARHFLHPHKEPEKSSPSGS